MLTSGSVVFGGLYRYVLRKTPVCNSLSIVLLVGVFFLLLFWFSTNQKQNKLLLLLPGPPAWPVVGNLPQLGSRVHVTLTEMSRRYGNVFRVRLGSRDVVIVNGYETIRKALLSSSDFAGRPDMDTFHYMSVDRSLALMSHCEKWKAIKKLCVHLYTVFAGFDGVSAATVKMAERLTLKLTKLDKGDTNILLLIRHAMYRLLFEAGLGINPDDSTCSFERFINCAEYTCRVQKSGNIVDFFPWLQFVKLIDGRLDKMESKLSGVSKDLEETLRKSVQSVKETDTKECLVSKLAGLITDAEGHTKISTHLDDNRYITQILMEFMIAGASNTSAVLNWFILYLAKFPKYQDWARQEIETHFGPDSSMDYSTFHQLTRTRALVLEVLRHASAVPLSLPHKTIRETRLAGHVIPTDTMVFTNLYSCNRDTSLWVEPHEFRPERFLAEDGSGLDMEKARLIWMCCFGMGRRKCVAHLIAREIIVLSAVVFLRRCRFAEAPGAALDLNCSFAPVMEPVPQPVIVTPVR